MDLELSSEQSMLKDSVDKAIAETYGAEARRGFMARPEGWSRDNWARFAEMGLLGLGISEEEGGFGGGPVETMIVMEAFGRGLVVEPYLGSAVLAGGILRHARFAGREALLAGVVDGSQVLALAHEEQDARYSLSRVRATARKEAGGWVLDGRKVNVPGAGGASLFFVSARCGGGADAREGIALFAVPAGTKGLDVSLYPGIDGTTLATVELSGVAVDGAALVAGPELGFQLVERAVDEAIAALCGEAVGVMEAMLDNTVAYLKTRSQFGGPIGRFQALQHRAAEMYVALEQARSMAIYAAASAGAADRRERRRAISFAKVQVGRSLRFVGQQAVQLAGGIGVTDEYIVGQQFKRSSVIERQFGDADHHLSLIDALDRAS